MRPTALGKHNRARSKKAIARHLLKIFLALALVIGFAPISKGIAVAADQPEEGGFVPADLLVEGTSDNQLPEPVTTVGEEPAGQEGLASPEEAAEDGLAPDDVQADAIEPATVDEAPVELGDEATDGSADEAEAAVSEELASDDSAAEGYGPEGPEYSFRYVDGVPVDSAAPSSGRRMAPRANSLVSTPTWDKSCGSKGYVYLNASGKPVAHTFAASTGVGIDVSEHQGDIDWAKVKADGISFALIRVGYGSDFESQDDKYFSRNVDGALQNGIAVGVYLYSHATKVSGGTGSAESEAQHVLRLLKDEGLSPSVLTLPVYYDMEQDHPDKIDQGDLSPSQLGDIAERFCNTISSAGYKVGIYSNLSWWKEKLTSSKFNNSNWSRWVAQWGDFDKPQASFDYGLWQFTSHGTVSGINGAVDMNFSTGSIYGPKNKWLNIGGYYYYYDSNGSPVKWAQKIDGKFYYFNGLGQMQTGWVQWSSDKTWSYFQPDGSAKIGWMKYGSSWYYFKPDTGRSAKWEAVVSGQEYYFNNACLMQVGWIRHGDGSWSYHDASGKALTGWMTLGGQTYYLHPDTRRAAKWETTIGGKEYYFNGSNHMKTGWIKHGDGSWSYHASNGAAATGWKLLSGKWYYLDKKTHRALKGEGYVDGQLYYFNGNNEMVTGWVRVADGSWIYCNSSGAAASGWKLLSGAWYYLDPKTHKAAKWETMIDGKLYYFNGSNAMRTGWVMRKGGVWSYFNSNGAAASGWKKLSGVWYYLDPKTYLAAQGMTGIDGSWYYFNSANAMVTGWLQWSDDKTWSYFGSGGAALLGWQSIGGKRYYFDPATGRSFQGNHKIDGEDYYFGADSALVSGGAMHMTEGTGVMLKSFTQAQRKVNSSSSVPSAMNPASYPKGSNGYYQFARLDKGYSGIVSAEQINAFLNSTASGRAGTLKGTGQYFIDAAKLYGVNEIYLLAHAIHETAWGTSNFAKGYVCNGATYYSFYGIAAFDSNPNNTQNYAVKQGWNSIRNGIVGGAQWISTNYVKNITCNQNTLYKMRWNYPQYARGQGVGHQYATDPLWASKIANIMASAYKSMGISQDQCGLTFFVPQYA